MPDIPRMLLRGFHLSPYEACPFGHRIGGPSELPLVDCPCCGHPFMAYLTLDLRDSALEPLRPLFPALRDISLTYCMRCSLCWADCIYRLRSDGSLQFVEWACTDPQTRAWEKRIGVEELPEVRVSLRPVPDDIQRTILLENANQPYSTEAKAAFGSFFRCYSSPETGSRPLLDFQNQLGGIPFLAQDVLPIDCLCCRRVGNSTQMELLASLYNNPHEGILVGFEGVQVLFFVCPTCAAILAMHRV